MCYGSGKTNLYFVEGYAAGQENVPHYLKRKKTVNQDVYRNEMCPNMFHDIRAQMGQHTWTWQQDGAKAHTARETVSWLRQNAPDFIEPDQWPSKSPDLNVLDYCIWSLLLHRVNCKGMRYLPSKI